MGEAKRKRTNEDWERDLRAFVKSTQVTSDEGLRDVMVIHKRDELALLTACLDGDDDARRIAKVLATTLKDIRNPDAWPSGKPALCLTCDHEFAKDTPPAFVLQFPFNWHEESCFGVASPVCERCEQRLSDADLIEHLARAWNGRLVKYGEA